MSAAEQLLSVRPAEAVNVDEIAALADVAKGTFYNYFTDKDALVREVEEAVREELEQRIAQTNDGIEDCAERVARAFAAMLNWALADPTKARTLLRMTPHFADPNAPSNSGVRGDVHAGVAAGRFTGIADEAGIVLVLSVLTGGVNRALDLVQKKKVRVLGESLAQALLVALGLPRGDAEAVASRAMALVR
ncbi:TetR/AcrR family transcriptional regulator [Phenylobacterium montanum]|uniref:Helix-turn-helix transcriptional regulator n=1 Tax=Phenylobacterium montanum TaxID=2823693 RepID=A0A975G311_9CAUL|nr:TetR/AcrR family transcriptional regulator [Caulobacter sp. S6]QUD90215.1 helix-turn-helix transcriptional regulator [Caulobacter sp. S6]